jgi:hypothetical protein
MGLLRNRDDGPHGRRFQMREKLASIGDDSWIEDDQGDRVCTGPPCESEPAIPSVATARRARNCSSVNGGSSRASNR